MVEVGVSENEGLACELIGKDSPGADPRIQSALNDGNLIGRIGKPEGSAINDLKAVEPIKNGVPLAVSRIVTHKGAAENAVLVTEACSEFLHPLKGRLLYSHKIGRIEVNKHLKARRAVNDIVAVTVIIKSYILRKNDYDLRVVYLSAGAGVVFTVRMGELCNPLRLNENGGTSRAAFTLSISDRGAGGLNRGNSHPVVLKGRDHGLLCQDLTAHGAILSVCHTGLATGCGIAEVCRNGMLDALTVRAYITAIIRACAIVLTVTRATSAGDEDQGIHYKY